MRIFLAGVAGFLQNYLSDLDLTKERLYLLESYFYAKKLNSYVIKNAKAFLLDSGAYTFMQSSKKAVNWEEYLEEYIDFINKNDVKDFFELDIDSITGYKYVLELRKKLEIGTNKKCIPVFHKSRGLQEWENICKEYDYVSIGTIGDYDGRLDILMCLLEIASKYKTKVHGLGFTRLNVLPKMSFYSVDSTSWCCGNRYGFLDRFNGTTIEKIAKPSNTRFKDIREVLRYNFNEWVKYQKYMDLKY